MPVWVLERSGTRSNSPVLDRTRPLGRASFRFAPPIVIILKMKGSPCVEAGWGMAEKRMVCPKCGQADAVRKVTSLVSAGTVLTDTSGLGLATSENGGELVGLMGWSISRSVLVAKLSPPRKPARPFGYGCIGLFLLTRVGLALFVLLMVIPAAVCSFPFLITTYRENVLLIFVPITMVAVVGIVLLYWIIASLWREARSIRENRRDFPVRYQQWERASARWQRLYYCFRDDGVFLDGQTLLVPAGQMRFWLYSSTRKK